MPIIVDMNTKKSPSQLRPFDANGKPIDASFSLEVTENGFAILYASRGGTKGTRNARNSEYHIGLTAILSRLQQLDATVTDILLDSIAARQRPLLERALEIPDNVQFPLRLAVIGDMDTFRRKISDAQKNVLAAPGRNTKHGNRMRSIRILFNLSKSNEMMSSAAIAQILVGDDAIFPTADRGVLEQRVTRLKSRGSVPRPDGNRLPAAQESASVMRYVRSPAVVAYVVQRAAGLCELCGRSPFITDSGAVFLEVHHLVQLSAGGPDTPCNTAALCPNCHRELHYGTNRMRLIALLYERVPELQPVRFRSAPGLNIQAS
jgi:5-methylcytosine-specific restriction protein A